MAVLGRLLVSSAERLDLPDLLSLDSYAAGDWKYFLKSLVGDTKPFILKGFDIIDPGNAIGTQSCSIRVADSITYYPGSNSGSFFHGLQEGHTQAAPLVPELRKNAVNYVYLTFSTFNTSVDTRAFWDPDKDGGAGGEFTQDINTESVLKVDVNVSTGSFPANTVPVAKVTVGPVVITAIEDARDMMFRLGSGGINPNPFNTYGWRSLPAAGYEREEPPTQMLAGGVNPFQGADKNILTLKEWMDAVMSKLRELGGTTYWYDDTSSFGIITNFFDAVATTFKSKGQWIHDSATPGLVTWTEDIHIKMTSDPRTYIVRAGNKTLANEQVMYIPMVRNQPLNPTDESVSWTNGQPYVNTIGGAVGLFANLAKGDWVKKANDSFDKWLRVEEFYDAVNLGGSTTTAAGARSVRLSDNYLGTTGEEKGRYDKGIYLASDVVTSDRDVAAIYATGGNFHWLSLRSDTIESVGSAVSTTLSCAISEHDGATAKVTATAHGLVDGDRVTIDGTTNFDGTYKVEVETVDIFYISVSGGPFADESGSGYYGTVTTVARSTPYGVQEESANHGFRSDDTIIVAGTTNYNSSYKINVTSATTFTIPLPASFATENIGTATLARMIVRAEGGGIDIVQGQSIDIGGSVADNIRQYLGMGSLSETSPSYSIPPSYNTLDGQQNYNGILGENITSRISKLTAMMADKAQDKTIKLLPSGYESVTNTTNGSNQEIVFNPGPTPPPKLDVVLPSSANNGTVGLTGTLVLPANSAAYITIDRNAAFSYATLAAVQVAALSSVPLEENTLVLAVRLATSEVWLWDGFYVSSGAPVPVPGTLDLRVNQDRTSKLISGGTWSWNLGTETLDWTANAFLQIAGLANTVNQINTGSAVIAAGQVAYVSINRASPGGVIAVSVAAVASVPLGANIVVIARRDGNDIIVGNHSMRLIDGESKLLYAGSSDQTLTYTGQPDAADDTPTYTNVTNGLAPYPVVQGDDLTLAIGQTIGNVNGILTALDTPSYDEFREVVAAAPTGNQLLGPVIAGTIITLPVNSRLSGSPQQFYTVGKGTLEIFLNGQMLQLGEAGGWSEVGASLTPSDEIEINQQLEVGDFLTFRIDATGGPSSGGAGAPDDDFFTLPTSVSPDNGDYVLTYDAVDNAYRKQTRATFLSGVGGFLNVNTYAINTLADINDDDVILVNAAGGNVTISLPPAATADGKVFYIKKVDATANQVIIDADSSELIDGALTVNTTVQFESFTITSDGTNWWIL